MRLLFAIVLLFAAPVAHSDTGGLEPLFQESSRLVIEINALDRDLQLYTVSFGRRGRSPSSAEADAKRLQTKASSILKRWKAPSKEWKSLDPGRRRELESMRAWIEDLKRAVLGERLKDRAAFAAAAAACDEAGMRRGLERLCASGCSPGAETLLQGYAVPCSLKAAKAALAVEINRQLLLGGKHRAAIENGTLKLTAHETEAVREPLSRYWQSLFPRIEAADPAALAPLILYGNFIGPAAPEAATDASAVERVLAIWGLAEHSDPPLLLAQAEAAAKRAYEELSGEAAAAARRAAGSGGDSLPAARDAIARVLRAGGSERGVSNEDAEKLLAAPREAVPENTPAHSLLSSIRAFSGESALATIDERGRAVFASGDAGLRVVADPLTATFRICRAPCGPGDFLAIDGAPVPAAAEPAAAKPKKKRGWWFGGSDDEKPAPPANDAPPPPPTRFLIQELR